MALKGPRSPVSGTGAARFLVGGAAGRLSNVLGVDASEEKPWEDGSLEQVAAQGGRSQAALKAVSALQRLAFLRQQSAMFGRDGRDSEPQQSAPEDPTGADGTDTSVPADDRRPAESIASWGSLSLSGTVLRVRIPPRGQPKAESARSPGSAGTPPKELAPQLAQAPPPKKPPNRAEMESIRKAAQDRLRRLGFDPAETAASHLQLPIRRPRVQVRAEEVDPEAFADGAAGERVLWLKSGDCVGRRMYWRNDRRPAAGRKEPQPQRFGWVSRAPYLGPGLDRPVEVEMEEDGEASEVTVQIRKVYRVLAPAAAKPSWQNWSGEADGPMPVSAALEVAAALVGGAASRKRSTKTPPSRSDTVAGWDTPVVIPTASQPGRQAPAMQLPALPALPEVPLRYRPSVAESRDDAAEGVPTTSEYAASKDNHPPSPRRDDESIPTPSAATDPPTRRTPRPPAAAPYDCTSKVTPRRPGMPLAAQVQRQLESLLFEKPKPRRPVVPTAPGADRRYAVPAAGPRRAAREAAALAA
eukprot:TRINITY_DN27761_c0_g1_i1.p1 TRINITY_DN27761_c0_g1~~TRINITY_DN27761_c0_g1_i1.p1  ORF type:complete len:546 (+),score=135.08 TRINITY_DN27761_c0_g1_i1:60-1640(+)